jgi:hypothetical protein
MGSDPISNEVEVRRLSSFPQRDRQVAGPAAAAVIVLLAAVGCGDSSGPDERAVGRTPEGAILRASVDRATLGATDTATITVRLHNPTRRAISVGLSSDCEALVVVGLGSSLGRPLTDFYPCDASAPHDLALAAGETRRWEFRFTREGFVGQPPFTVDGEPYVYGAGRFQLHIGFGPLRRLAGQIVRTNQIALTLEP